MVAVPTAGHLETYWTRHSSQNDRHDTRGVRSPVSWSAINRKSADRFAKWSALAWFLVIRRPACKFQCVSKLKVKHFIDK